MNDAPVQPLADADAHARLVAELERRMDLLQGAPESEFGAFTATDWLLCIGGFVVIPYLLYFWFWP